MVSPFLRIPMSFSINRLTALAVICYIDLLFFPYYQVIIIPYSLPVAVIGLLECRRIIMPPKTKNMLIITSLFMSLSVTASLFLPESSDYIVENIKRLFQFSTSFLYFFFFYNVARRYKLENYLLITSVFFLVYFLLWALFFVHDPLAVNSLMSSLYGRLVTSSANVAMHGRFAYLFTDPNTAGYFLLIAVLPWLHVARNFILRVIIIVLSSLAILFLASRGVIISLILAVCLWAIPLRAILLRFRKSDFKKTLKYMPFVFIAFVIFTFMVPRIFGDLALFISSIERISSLDGIQQGGLRFPIWSSYVTSLTPLPIGRGYMFKTQFAGLFIPHSDLLRLLYSYGFIVATLFLSWFLRSGRKYPLLLVPALMAFGINTLIDEQKLFALFLGTLGVLIGIRQRDSDSTTNTLSINKICDES